MQLRARISRISGLIDLFVDLEWGRIELSSFLFVQQLPRVNGPVIMKLACLMIVFHNSILNIQRLISLLGFRVPLVQPQAILVVFESPLK